MGESSLQIPDPAYLKWPSNASTEYINARRALLEEEYALVQQIEKVAEQRRALVSGPVLPKYVFEEGAADLSVESNAKKVTLLDIAKENELGHKTLLVYHLMMGENDTKACSACSMFIDGLNGVAKHLAQRFILVIIAKAPLPAIRNYARKRQWNDLRFLSSHDNSFNKDMGVENPEWIQNMPQGPGLSVFRLEEGKDDVPDQIRFWYQGTPQFGRRHDNEVLRGMDLLCPVWQLLDLTPEGRGDWDPSHSYAQKWLGVTY